MLTENSQFRCRLKRLTSKELQWLDIIIAREKGHFEALKWLINYSMTSFESIIDEKIKEHEQRCHLK